MHDPDNQRIMADPSTASSDIDDEVVVLNMARGRYYGLNEVAGQVWHWMREPRTRQELIDLLVAEFEVDPERAAADLDRLLDDLRGRELVVDVP